MFIDCDIGYFVQVGQKRFVQFFALRVGYPVEHILYHILVCCLEGFQLVIQRPVVYGAYQFAQRIENDFQPPLFQIGYYAVVGGYYCLIIHNYRFTVINIKYYAKLDTDILSIAYTDSYLYFTCLSCGCDFMWLRNLFYNFRIFYIGIVACFISEYYQIEYFGDSVYQHYYSHNNPQRGGHAFKFHYGKYAYYYQ